MINSGRPVGPPCYLSRVARPATRDPLPPTAWPFPERGKTVNVRKAARLLGVDKKTVYRMATAGEVRSTTGRDGLRVNLMDLFIRAFQSTPDGSRGRRSLDEMNAQGAARLGVRTDADGSARIDIYRGPGGRIAFTIHLPAEVRGA